MKKILILSLCLLVNASLLAQGRINFNNANATSPIRIGFGPTTQILGTASTATFGIGPASVQIRLYGGATSTTLAPLLIGTAGTAEYVLNSGNTTLAAAQGTFPGGSTLNVGATSPMYLRFTAITPDYSWMGVSPIILVTPSLVPATPTAVFAATADSSHWNGITLWIPEPSSFALLSLGAAALMASRRRK
jgi:hypothetical protein